MTTEVFINFLREKSREIAPDYPCIKDELEHWEHLWAITSSYEGTKMANDDLHSFIKYLCNKFNIDLQKEVLEFVEIKKNGK